MNAPHTKPPGGGQIKFTLKFITPEMAQELLNVNFKNRRFRKVVIARYCKDLEEGLWVPTHQALGISSTGRLLDGEHRCKAIVTSGIRRSRVASPSASSASARARRAASTVGS